MTRSLFLSLAIAMTLATSPASRAESQSAAAPSLRSLNIQTSDLGLGWRVGKSAYPLFDLSVSDAILRQHGMLDRNGVFLKWGDSATASGLLIRFRTVQGSSWFYSYEAKKMQVEYLGPAPTAWCSCKPFSTTTGNQRFGAAGPGEGGWGGRVVFRRDRVVAFLGTTRAFYDSTTQSAAQQGSNWLRHLVRVVDLRIQYLNG